MNGWVDVGEPVRRARSRVPARWQSSIDRADQLASRSELPLLLAIIAAIPLEFTKLWFPVTWVDVSRIGISAALAILLLHVAAGTVRLRRSPLLLAIGAVAVIELASFALTRWPLGPKEAFATMAYAGFALFVAHVLSSHRSYGAIAMVLLASALMVGLISIAQEIGNFSIWPLPVPDPLGRRSSTFGDPNIAARFLAMSVIIGLASLAALDRRRREPRGWLHLTPRRAVALIALTIAVLAVADVLTLSRIGWVTAVLAIAMWLPMAIRRRTIVIGIAAFAIAFGGYLILAPTASTRASSVASDAITRIGADAGDDGVIPPDLTLPADPSAVTPFDGVIEHVPIDSVRRYLIRAGVAMTIDHPILGVGVGGFDAELRSSYWKYVPLDRRGSPTTLLHTDVMRVIAETGLVGLAGWAVLLFTVGLAVRRGLRSGNDLDRLATWAAVAAIIVIIAASQFAGRFYTEPYLWLSLGILLAIPAMAPVRDGRPAAA